MARQLVNLDALVIREDFEVENETMPPSRNRGDLSISDLQPNSLTFQVLRKPDFQRETANWSPERIAGLVKSFLDGDLIPAIILWRSPTSGNLFVIDGAHRLSALIAWVHDDYGDRKLSREFYNNAIPREQVLAAEKTRKIVADTVGSFLEIEGAGKNPTNSPPERVLRARNMASLAIELQWVNGDAQRAEDSYFKINQEATLIDPTELIMLKSRNKPNAIAARALIRAGVGHKYWSAFPEPMQRQIEKIAREVYEMLFTPELETPIKTLDLPVAGKGYSAESVGLVFDFVNFANKVPQASLRPKKTKKPTDIELQVDGDGSQTLAFLKNVKALAFRISGNDKSSLGLHPAVYFYGATGRYQPPVFLAIARFIQELDEKKRFPVFTEVRDRFEEFLLKYRYFTNQIVGAGGSGTRSLEPLLSYYRTLLDAISDGKSDAEIVASLQAIPRLKSLQVVTEEDKTLNRNFTRDVKSAVFLRESLEKALRCKICNGRIHKEAITFDHIKRKEDGGLGGPDNAQMAHPYCNTGYKEKTHHESLPAEDAEDDE